MPQAVPQKPKPKQETEHIPGPGELLAQDYLIRRSVQDSATDAALVRLVDRVRSEYVRDVRDARGTPETQELVDFIRGRVSAMAGNNEDPKSLYVGIMNEITDYSRRPKQKPSQDMAA